MCEFCMRNFGADHECGKDYPIHPCANGGLVASAARDYYYQNYASEEERKSMDREDKIQTIIAIIFMIVFWVAVGFAVMSSFVQK